MNSSSADQDTTDIVCLSLSRWDAPISSPAWSLVKELSKSTRVFYIEHPFSWKDFWKERNGKQIKTRKDALLYGKNIYTQPDSQCPNLTAVTPPLVYPVNFLPGGRLYRYLSQRNDERLRSVLRGVLREQAIGKFIFINFFDPFFLRQFPGDLRPEKYVYQCMDDLSQVAYTRRHAVRLEEEVIRAADITLCTSRELTRLRSALSPNVHFFPNAADTTLFGQAMTQRLPRPPDLQFGNRKVIGFAGSIEYRTDFELLRKIALHHSDKILFLLGPVYGNEDVAAGLRQLPNVFFSGPRPLQEIPAYLQYFDCCIIPYKLNTLTRSIYPLKINEYLAAGKPVVTTAFSEDIRSFREVAHLAGSHEQFLSAINHAISDDSEQKKQQRVHVAGQNSWVKRGEQFWGLVR